MIFFYPSTKLSRQYGRICMEIACRYMCTSMYVGEEKVGHVRQFVTHSQSNH